MMLRREALVFTNRLYMHSKPLSRPSMLTSKPSSLLRAISIVSNLASSLEMAPSENSTLSNSFMFSAFSSQETAPLCINLETSDHLLSFGFNTGVDNNKTSDWKMEMLIILTSLSSLIIVERW